MRRTQLRSSGSGPSAEDCSCICGASDSFCFSIICGVCPCQGSLYPHSFNLISPSPDTSNDNRLPAFIPRSRHTFQGITIPVEFPLVHVRTISFTQSPLLYSGFEWDNISMVINITTPAAIPQKNPSHVPTSTPAIMSNVIINIAIVPNSSTSIIFPPFPACVRYYRDGFFP